MKEHIKETLAERLRLYFSASGFVEDTVHDVSAVCHDGLTRVVGVVSEGVKKAVTSSGASLQRDRALISRAREGVAFFDRIRENCVLLRDEASAVDIDSSQ